jgi:FkbM family methyltransferase
MSLEDALLLVCERARLIQGMPPGRMLAVGLSETAIRPMLTPSLSLAAINGPAMSVVAGPSDAVSELSGRLAEAGIAQLAVHSAHAFHSQMLAELKEPLCALFGSVKLHPPTIPYLSNRSGTWITAAEATDPHHWARHTIETVRFADGLTELCGDPQRVFLEVGPGQTLCSLVLQLTSAQPRTQPSLPAAHEADADTATLAQALAWLWSQGLPVNWAGQHAGEARRRVALPTYSFERQRYWIAAPATTDQGTPAADQPAASSSEPLQPPTDGTPFPESAFEPPASDFEAAVIDIWRELFHVEQISVNDNFFALGGNSLLAVQFFSRLRALYQVELPLRAVFQTPTPRGIATELENALLAELDKLSDDEARAQTTRDNALGHPEVPRVTPTLYTLPDGLRVWQFNQVETDHFHHDIFESRVYHRNGIRFDDRAVIFDIGANIGLFSLYASRQCHQPQIHAFEPAPPVFRLLQDNLAANAVEAHLLNCGISDASGARQLTFYPLSTGMSSFHADRQQEQEVLHAIMLNQQQQGMPGMDEVMDWADQILEQRFQALDFECRMVTVSEVMRERGLARIDLMKIDVQKCELEVLQGIDDEHWPAIRQIVIEVHDLDGRVAQVAAMLRQRGYEVVVEQELLYRSSNISNLYAIRP